MNGVALVDECPEYLEGKTILTDEQKEKQAEDEGEVDPVDPLVDMFMSGVKATQDFTKNVFESDYVKKSTNASAQLFEQSQPVL